MEERPSPQSPDVTGRTMVLRLDLFEVRHEPDGVRARPIGLLRVLPAVFACVWLTGWAVGETFAWRGLQDVWRDAHMPAETLLPALTRDPAAWLAILPTAFVAFWLATWTFAGILLAWIAARWTAGWDLVRVTPSGLEVTRGLGPLSFRRTYARESVSSFLLRRRRLGLMAVVSSRPRRVLSYGTPEQLLGARDHLSGLLGLPAVDLGTLPAELPTSFSSRSDLAGNTLLERREPGRWVATGVLWVVAGSAGFGVRWVLAQRAVWNEVSLVAGAMLGTLCLLLGWRAVTQTFARSRYRLAHGRVVYERTFAGWTHQKEFAPPRLVVAYATDSDGDETCSLTVRAGERSRVIVSTINHSEEVLQLARWLERETGGELSIPRGLRAA